MDDLISRRELFKRIRIYEEEYGDKLKGIAYIKFLIRDMPTIEAETDNGWISVKDRLPESDKIVLIYVCGHRETAYYDNLKRAFILTKDENLDFGMCAVTHWQPLPKPPKEDISREESNEQLYGGYEEDRKTMIGSNE